MRAPTEVVRLYHLLIIREISDVARLAPRHRPEGQPVMHQDWGKLLFMHWRIKESVLRPHIPRDLEIDTFGGSAWIAITPFTIWDVRAFPPFIPSFPGLDSMHELTVRTYVHYNGVPGIWFFSLDTNNPAEVIAARTFFHLPYYDSEIDLELEDELINYQLVRDEGPAAEFRASWTIGKKLPASQPGTREFFLTERYVIYSEIDGDLYRARFHHQPWPLQKAKLHDFESSMVSASGLPEPKNPPLLYYAEEVNVDIWQLESADD